MEGVTGKADGGFLSNKGEAGRQLCATARDAIMRRHFSSPGAPAGTLSVSAEQLFLLTTHSTGT